jgi:hypothetical protein
MVITAHTERRSHAKSAMTSSADIEKIVKQRVQARISVIEMCMEEQVQHLEKCVEVCMKLTKRLTR